MAGAGMQWNDSNAGQKIWQKCKECHRKKWKVRLTYDDIMMTSQG